MLNMADTNDVYTSKMAHEQDAYDIEKRPLQSKPAERIGTYFTRRAWSTYTHPIETLDVDDCT